MIKTNIFSFEGCQTSFSFQTKMRTFYFCYWTRQKRGKLKTFLESMGLEVVFSSSFSLSLDKKLDWYPFLSFIRVLKIHFDFHHYLYTYNYIRNDQNFTLIFLIVTVRVQRWLWNVVEILLHVLVWDWLEYWGWEGNFLHWLKLILQHICRLNVILFSFFNRQL